MGRRVSPGQRLNVRVNLISDRLGFRTRKFNIQTTMYCTYDIVVCILILFV